MSKKKTFSPIEKEELLKAFGKPLTNESLQIIEEFHNSGKDMNKLLKTAYKFKALC